MNPARLRVPHPAWIALAVGLGVVLLRPALPIDETRYLEVFREHLEGSPFLLHLSGEPYAEKPPLLFWLGRLLVAAGAPMDLALRVLPALATALTVVFTERIGRRTGLALAGWVQAALWLPALAGQMLLFDSLLAAAVWGALEAWTGRRDRTAAAWSALAFLAKGPVALLFLVPLLWALRPLRGPQAGDGRRAAVMLGLALLPLAAWALGAALAGGPEFGRALLWERWGGRIAATQEHARPLWFYLPIVLVGALPATFFLRRPRSGQPGPPAWFHRFLRALIVVLLAFTLIRGKQAHYLVPAAPALALLVAWRLEHEPGARRALWRGVLTQAGLLLALVGAVVTFLPRLEPSAGSAGRAWLARGGQVLPLAATALLLALGMFLAVRARAASPRALLVLATGIGGLAPLPLHAVAGRLLYPHALAAALREPHTQVACYGSLQNGLISLLSQRTTIVRLEREADLIAFAGRDREALVVVDAERLPAGVPPGLDLLAQDTAHRTELLVLRARAEHPPPRPD